MNIKVSYRDQIQLILLSILPAALITGPLISEIIVNVIVIFFIIEILIKKKFHLLKENLFLYFTLFYFFLILSLLNSDIFSKSALNVFFYFRFFLFAFAVKTLFQRQGTINKYIYYVLSITIFIVVIDGYIQFFSGQNIFGFPKYRIDRLSGFFNDELILGSYLLRVMPILLGLTLFFKDRTKIIYYFNLLLILLTTLLIFLSGERASFFLLIILLFIIGILIDIKTRIKIFFLAVVLSFITFMLIFNFTIFDRHIVQFKKQVFDNQNQKFFLSEYVPMFKTSLKMFKTNSIVGLGPKSYRYYCRDEAYVNYYSGKYIFIDNKFSPEGIEKKNIRMVKYFVKEGDVIDFGDKLFSYKFRGDDKIRIYHSSKNGKIKEIKYGNPDFLITIEINSCNTHPHNIYFQLLAETGIIGFLFVFSLFLYILYIISKHTINLFFFGKRGFSNLEICLLACFFIFLWPITTSGNFFNNWLNIISFYPLGFYLFEKKKNY